MINLALMCAGPIIGTEKCGAPHHPAQPISLASMSAYVIFSDKYKIMCGYKMYILVKVMQNDLNVYKLSLIQRLETNVKKWGDYKNTLYNNNDIFIKTWRIFTMYSVSFHWFF